MRKIRWWRDCYRLKFGYRFKSSTWWRVESKLRCREGAIVTKVYLEQQKGKVDGNC